MKQVVKEVLESRENPPVQKEEHGKDQQYVTMILTRAQQQRKLSEELTSKMQDEQSGVTPTKLEVDNEGTSIFHFSDDLFGETKASRMKLTKRQKRMQSRQKTNAIIKNQGEEISKLQSMDESIQTMVKSDKTYRFFTREGLLFRKWSSREAPDEVIEQLVLPEKFRR